MSPQIYTWTAFDSGRVRVIPFSKSGSVVTLATPIYLSYQINPNNDGDFQGGVAAAHPHYAMSPHAGAWGSSASLPGVRPTADGDGTTYPAGQANMRYLVSGYVDNGGPHAIQGVEAGNSRTCATGWDEGSRHPHNNGWGSTNTISDDSEDLTAGVSAMTHGSSGAPLDTRTILPHVPIVSANFRIGLQVDPDVFTAGASASSLRIKAAGSITATVIGSYSSGSPPPVVADWSACTQWDDIKANPFFVQVWENNVEAVQVNLTFTAIRNRTYMIARSSVTSSGGIDTVSPAFLTGDYDDGTNAKHEMRGTWLTGWTEHTSHGVSTAGESGSYGEIFNIDVP